MSFRPPDRLPVFERQVRAHVRRLAEAGRDGGLVIATHSIGPDASVASYELCRRTAAEGLRRRGTP